MRKSGCRGQSEKPEEKNVLCLFEWKNIVMISVSLLRDAKNVERENFPSDAEIGRIFNLSVSLSFNENFQQFRGRKLIFSGIRF
jgi:hypothetical protein